MTAYVYYSTDASAPTLANVAGQLVTVFDNCLVAGYSGRTPAGWTKPYTSTNIADFKAASGNAMYLWMDDSNTAYARLRGYQAMSAHTTGTDPFPTDAQVSGGLYMHKNAGAGTKLWMMNANGSALNFWVDFGADNGLSGHWCYFGDLADKTYSSDAWHTLLMANASATATSTNVYTLTALLGSNTGGHYMPRRYNATGTCINVGKHSDQSRTGTTVGAGSMPYPHAPDQKMYVAPLWVHQYVAAADVHIRGRMQGVWVPLHNKPLSNWDTFSGTAGTALEDKTFIAVNIYNVGQILLETSNTW